MKKPVRGEMAMTERRSGSPDGKEEKPDSTPSFLSLK